MIRYTLKCAEGHGFDSWFASGAAYDALASSGHVTCPHCGTTQVEKSLMLPALKVSREPAPAAVAAPRADVPAAPVGGDPKGSGSGGVIDRAAAIAALRREIEAKSDYVGMEFAAEARKIHEGSAPERAIYGEARPDEARKLIEDRIPVAPLPFIPARRVN